MAVVYQSEQAAENTGIGATLTITKPTSLAVGDLMIALLWGRRNINTWATLSGWTKLGNATSTAGTDSNLTVLAKVAVSGDVAASNFTFTPDGAHEEKRGVVMRITGEFSGGIGSLISSVFDSDVTPAGGEINGTAVTPVGDDSILILAAIGNSSATVSSYEVANNNPSWTERNNGQVGTSVQLIYAVGTATYAALTTTGISTLVTNDSNTYGMALISVSEVASPTVSPPVQTATFSIQAPSITGDANVTATTVTATFSVQTPTIGTTAITWTNESLPSTSTWTDESKE